MKSKLMSGIWPAFSITAFGGGSLDTSAEAIEKAVDFKEELLTVQLEELHSGMPFCPEE